MPVLETMLGQSQLQRRCIVSGETLPTDRLIRFVVGPKQQLVPDIRGKLGGRGIWVGAVRSTIDAAINQNLFNRAARTDVNIPENLSKNIECQLLERVQGHLSLARKAGQAIAGYEKVLENVSKGGFALVLTASDASFNAQKKLSSLATGLVQVDCLSGSEMGVVFGRERTAHAAVAIGGLASQIKIDGRRLAEFRGKPSLNEVRHDAEV
ncbi:MAG: hypothetical protein CMM28_01255 [Rhodospirillaceae bacterium]|nr:hypothetical protein [Rhodospirillaceae bacterium]